MIFDKAVAFVLEQEGGYSNDPNDPGAETRFGISKRAYPSLNIAQLSEDDAKRIYRTDYWDRLSCDQLPHGLDVALFDCAVNQGPGNAVRMLQNALEITSDGIIGAVTIRAAQNRVGLLSEFLARRMYQYALNPNVHRYGLGWYRRIGALSQYIHQ
jgi:lysozyme family protein